MAIKTYTIWSNDFDTLESIAEDIMSNDEEVHSEIDARYLAAEYNAEDLEDERTNLNIEVGDEIILIANLGLWFGRRMGYRLLHTTNIKDIFDTTSGEEQTFFVDDRGDLLCRDCHHDGTNIYTYRAWKGNMSDQQKENFLDKVYRGIATRKDITKYTRKIGVYVADVYGWKVRR